MNKLGKSFWQNGLSIDETKISVLVLCLLMSMLFAGFNYMRIGDITNNFTDIITTLIWAVAGVNIASNVNKTFSRRNSNEPTQDGEDPPQINNNVPPVQGVLMNPQQNNQTISDNDDYKKLI